MTKPAPAHSSRIPLQVSGIDIRKLPIGPKEAFVWSRADGSSGLSEISISTGLDEDCVAEALAKLRHLGAIHYQGDEERPSSQSAAAQGPPPLASNSESPDATADSLDPAQLERLGAMLLSVVRDDHYRLLGVPRDASKAEIKDAYFSLVGDFHPDRYFGKDLGDTKAKLERVFTKLTQAHDTLTRHKRRKEYDSGLSPEPGIDPEESQMEASDRPSQEPRRNTLKSPARTVKVQRASVPTSGSSQRIATPQPPHDGGDASRTRPSDSEKRRRGLVRKLAAPAEPAQHSPGGASSGRLPAVNLRGLGPQPAIHRYLASAAEAEAEGNLVGMANSLRLAVAVRPDDPALSQRLQAVQARADVELADSHLAQAKSLEANQNFADAARRYARAARGRGSSDLFRQAAECFLKADNDLRQAGEHAKQAVHLDPENADLRLLLGKIYAQAGMRASALSELDKAGQLSPGDDTIKAWLKRVKNDDL